MTRRTSISTYSLRLASSIVVLALTALPSFAKGNSSTERRDSTRLLNGFAVKADIVGPIQLAVSDYGQYEAALQINLKDRYFPVIELGYGKASHTDDATQVGYETKAPFGRVGVDFNLLKNKHDMYRLYAGVRYAFTSFEFDITHPGVTDPVWGGTSPYTTTGIKGNQHWLEFCGGVDVTICGPLHLGWSLRYKQRLSYKKNPYGEPWYVPGYGRGGTSAFGALFNVSIDI